MTRSADPFEPNDPLPHGRGRCRRTVRIRLRRARLPALAGVGRRRWRGVDAMLDPESHAAALPAGSLGVTSRADVLSLGSDSRGSRGIASRVWLWRILAMIVAWVAFGVAVRGATLPVRTFLDSPPRFEALLLHRALSVAPVAFRNRSEADEFVRRVRAGEIKPAGQNAFYEIRYQAEPAAFFLRLLEDPADFERTTGVRGTPFAGRYASNWWSILAVKPAQIQVLNSSDGLDIEPGGKTNAYHQGNERWATEYLRLGLVDVLESTVRWLDEDSRFEARTESGQICDGRVEPGAQPSSVRIALDYRGVASGRFVHLQGTNDGNVWIPLAIQLVDWRDRPSNTNAYARYDVLEYRLSSRPLPRERFSPEPYLSTNDWWVELERGAHYVLRTEGTNLVRTLVEAEPGRLDLRPIAKVLLLVVLATMAVSTILAGIGWRRRSGRASRRREQDVPTEPWR